MKNKQLGITLLETILATAVLGMALAFAGAMLVKSVKDSQLQLIANEIIEFQYKIRNLITTTLIEKSDGSRVANPMLVDAISADTTVGFSGNNWFLENSCDEGELPLLKHPFFSCGYKLGWQGIDFNQMQITFTPISLNLKGKIGWEDYIRVKRFPTISNTQFVAENDQDIETLLSILARIVNAKKEDGFSISKDDINISYFTRTAGDEIRYTRVTSSEWSYNELIDDVVLLNGIILSKPTGSHLGFIIKSDFNSEVSIKRDGSIPFESSASLCWDGRKNIPSPCLSSLGTTEEEGAHVKVDGGLLFGHDDELRSPLTASYHHFNNHKPVNVPFIKCPKIAENRLVALASSFSSGIGEGSDFSNPEEIISFGPGKDKKHPYLTGLSLEWEEDAANKVWVVKGSIAVDPDLTDARGGVVQNPPSISFVTFQWCGNE